MNSSGLNDREFENLVREGITAARGGRRVLARRLFERAIAQKPTDARVWLWLSATTDDVVEQRNFLEKAVAADPYNAAAKRGLAILAKNHGSPVQNLVQQAHEDGFVAPEEGLLDPARTYRANTQTFD